MPSSAGTETYKDQGIYPPAGAITKNVYKGIGDKSTVQLVFNGNYEANDFNDVQIDALEQI